MNETFMEPITDADKIPKQRWKLVSYSATSPLFLADSSFGRNALSATYEKARVFSAANLPAFLRSMPPVLGRRSSLCL